MKRIRKLVYKNGKVRFVVEENRIFGFIPFFWTPCLIYDAILDMHFQAIFNSEDEARKFMLNEEDVIVNSSVIETSE